MSRKTCYILPLWSGKRRFNHPGMFLDSSFYVRQVIESLEKYKHSLSHLIVVNARNAYGSPKFDSYLSERLPIKVGNATVELMHRPNLGFSYGAYSDCYTKYRREFDYYMFQEDDTIYPIDNFDQIWLSGLLSGGDRCGFCCGRLAGGIDYTDGGDAPVHAGISCGIYRSSALESVFMRYGKLSHASSAEYVKVEQAGQVASSQQLFGNNWCATDISRLGYRVGFRYGDGEIKWFGNSNDPVIVQPL